MVGLELQTKSENTVRIFIDIMASSWVTFSVLKCPQNLCISTHQGNRATSEKVNLKNKMSMIQSLSENYICKVLSLFCCLGLLASKPVFGVSDKARQKSVFTATETTPAKFCSTNWRCSRTVLEHLELF